MSARLAPSSRLLPLLFVAFLFLFVFLWPSPPWVINVIIIIILGNQKQGPCMARPKKTRPRGACSKAAGDESRRTTIQCTLATPHTHPARSLPTPSPALTPFRGSNGIFAYAACLPAASLPHVPCFSRSPLARPLPCVDRSIGERNLTCLRALPAQLMELTTHSSDCAPARSSRSPLARPLPYVHRTIGERNFTEPLALPAQLMDLASYCRDCTSAHALALSHHVFPFYSA